MAGWDWTAGRGFSVLTVAGLSDTKRRQLNEFNGFTGVPIALVSRSEQIDANGSGKVWQVSGKFRNGLLMVSDYSWPLESARGVSESPETPLGRRTLVSWESSSRSLAASPPMGNVIVNVVPFPSLLSTEI